MPKPRAAERKPTTVAERRRALRGAKASEGPTVRKAELDLSTPGARKALTALFPRPTSDTMLEATKDLEAAAFDYIEARDAATVATKRKDYAGNVLCNAIGKNLGIVGDGWKASWDMSKGHVDWTKLAADLNIDDATLAKYRKPESRGLDVDETAEDA